ncbi:hypothetical protein GCM10007094_09570 [Pseudovibrio japonicus]|uniref:Uncharacterized protein n=1 Tax=Pseudovibrio japonicus TaxID=366534 RepID=A0ABQ3E3L0_9HYPH|nr:hypothetical protein GCM10007094_09570 [Pseudovibrio japonicus]
MLGDRASGLSHLKRELAVKENPNTYLEASTQEQNRANENPIYAMKHQPARVLPR